MISRAGRGCEHFCIARSLVQMRVWRSKCLNGRHCPPSPCPSPPEYRGEGICLPQYFGAGVGGGGSAASASEKTPTLALPRITRGGNKIAKLRCTLQGLGNPHDAARESAASSGS